MTCFNSLTARKVINGIQVFGTHGTMAPPLCRNSRTLVRRGLLVFNQILQLPHQSRGKGPATELPRLIGTEGVGSRRGGYGYKDQPRVDKASD